MSLFRRAINEQFIIVAVSFGSDLNESNQPVILSLISSSLPWYFEQYPDSYVVFFKRNEHKNAEMLFSSIQNAIISNELLGNFKVGKSEGELIAEVNWRGKVTFTPVGIAVNVAMQNQLGKYELQQKV